MRFLLISGLLVSAGCSMTDPNYHQPQLWDLSGVESSKFDIRYDPRFADRYRRSPTWLPADGFVPGAARDPRDLWIWTRAADIPGGFDKVGQLRVNAPADGHANKYTFVPAVLKAAELGADGVLIEEIEIPSRGQFRRSTSAGLQNVLQLAARQVPTGGGVALAVRSRFWVIKLR